MNRDELISVIDAARELGKRKQTVFKVLKRPGIQPMMRRDAEKRNQSVAHFTLRDLARVQADIEASSRSSGETAAPPGAATSAELGVFYLLQLEPESDPGRIKLGFAGNLADRIRTLRCAAPFVVEVKSWPCRRLWERTAMDCATDGCEQLHTEVFRTDSIDTIVDRCDSFFSLMPDPSSLGFDEQIVCDGGDMGDEIGNTEC